MSEINFKSGQREGPAKAFSKDGLVIESTYYKNGVASNE
jgi:antitoxin component YwqK of YwqJK toxin-antitoxin module